MSHGSICPKNDIGCAFVPPLVGPDLPCRAIIVIGSIRVPMREQDPLSS